MTHPERVEDYLEHIATGYLQNTENLAALTLTKPDPFLLKRIEPAVAQA